MSSKTQGFMVGVVVGVVAYHVITNSKKATTYPTQR